MTWNTTDSTLHGIKQMEIATDALIRKNNKILTIKRAKEPFKGIFALPGGRIEPGETKEEALCREVKEETGYKVKIIRLLGVLEFTSKDTKLRVYITEAKIAGGSNNPDPLEVEKLRWLTKKELISNLKKYRFPISAIGKLENIIPTI